MRIEHDRRSREQSDRREVLQTVIRHLGLQRRIGRVRAHGDHQRVSVGRGGATAPVPIMLAAPGRFSTTTVCPQLSCMRCASSRPSVSTEPPGANGTMIRIGLSGILVGDRLRVRGAKREARRRECRNGKFHDVSSGRSCFWIPPGGRLRPRSAVGKFRWMKADLFEHDLARKPVPTFRDHARSSNSDTARRSSRSAPAPVSRTARAAPCPAGCAAASRSSGTRAAACSARGPQSRRRRPRSIGRRPPTPRRSPRPNAPTECRPPRRRAAARARSPPDRSCSRRS